MFKHFALVLQKFKSNHVHIALERSRTIHIMKSANSLIIINAAVKYNLCLMTVTCKLQGSWKSFFRNSANQLPLSYGNLMFINMHTGARHWSLPKARRTNPCIYFRNQKILEASFKKPILGVMYSRDFLPPHCCNFHHSISPLQILFLTERRAKNYYNITPHVTWGRK
jgi:hypothetical protein